MVTLVGESWKRPGAFAAGGQTNELLQFKLDNVDKPGLICIQKSVVAIRAEQPKVSQHCIKKCFVARTAILPPLSQHKIP